MKRTNWIFVSLLLLAGTCAALAQTDESGELTASPPAIAQPQHAEKEEAVLDAQREKRALQIFLKSIEKEIVSAAEAMPADKYGFAPTDGESKGVRTFGQQVKHLAGYQPYSRRGRIRRGPAARCRRRAWTRNGAHEGGDSQLFAGSVRPPGQSDRCDRRQECDGQVVPNFTFNGYRGDSIGACCRGIDALP
jgi:hypothetical protein